METVTIVSYVGIFGLGLLFGVVIGAIGITVLLTAVGKALEK